VGVNILYFKWRDLYGRKTTTTIPVVDTAVPATDAGITAIRDAVRAMSNAKLIGHGLREGVNITDDSSSSSPYDVADNLVMKFRGVGRAVVRAVVKGVDSSLLTADENLIIETSGPGQDLKNAFLANLCDAAGNLVSGYLGSHRERAKRQVPLLTA